MKYLMLLFFVFTFSCSSSKIDVINRINNDSDAIVNLFLHKSIIRSRGQNMVLFCTHRNDKSNRYYFEINDNNFHFTNDSIEYMPDILGIRKVRGTELYKQELVSHVKALLSKMDQLDIRDVLGDLSSQGIDLKIYMKQFPMVLLYVSDIQKVNMAYWQKYINSMQKLNAKWYYSARNQE
ncbi:hypothetical protein DVR12_16655 [Chitinophaga silvatica]|uniref:Lipoprotein n=1 Tax=Chitinophaga silvatica TaxID=2282649 RepID=A0A3E1Y7A9_9BACT|nr:hypothetical protein [Chitinophaga silvatica]RFS20981.1 hypothetical protein DVR12_16655 [Chitinophaga silvatica]